MKSKLLLDKARIPLKICLKLAFKNLWKKKFRYLFMFILTTISLTFLSFTLELNGEKLRQNVYTMIENGYRYTNIYEHVSTTKDVKSNKYVTKNLTDDSYNKVKEQLPAITVHEYAKVAINYSKIEEERKNYFFTGTINNLIKYDNSNDYSLIAGRLPKDNTKEVLITDYIAHSFMYFNYHIETDTIYDYLNTRIKLNHFDDYVVVGIIKTNFDKWSHFTNVKQVETSDKENYAYTNDLIFMNSIILPEKYFNIEKDKDTSFLVFSEPQYNFSSSDVWSIVANDKEFANGRTLSVSSEEITVDKIKSKYFSAINMGRKPSNDNEIVISGSLIEPLFGYKYNIPKNNVGYQEYFAYENIYNNVIGQKITLSLGLNDYNKEYTIVGITSLKNIFDKNYTFDIFTSKDEYQKVSTCFSSNVKVMVELPEKSQDAYKLFKDAIKCGYVIDVFAYSSDIDFYKVDPFIDLASKAGLFIFSVFTLGIMWTIISIEIVDSRKEIGILRSIGLSSFKVSFIFVLQIVFVVVLSYLLSIYLSSILIPLYNQGITDEFNKITLYMYTYTYRTPLFLGIFVLFITFISTMLPLVKIMSNKIINVINERDN